MLPVVKNNIRLLLARKGTLFVLIALPIIVFSLGLLANGSGSGYTLHAGILDQDRTALSQALCDAFSDEVGKPVAVSSEEADKKLTDGVVEAVLIIPKGYEDAVLKGKTPALALRSLKGQEITGALSAWLNLYVDNLLRLREIENTSDASALLAAHKQLVQRTLPFEVRPLSAQKAHFGVTLAGGFLLYLLSLNMMQVGSLLLMEKQWNTLNRLLQSPLKRSGYIAANFITGVFFLAINLLSIFIVSVLIFRVDVPPLLFALWAYYGMIWILSAIFLALIARSGRVYSAVTSIVTILFAMLGGCYWPLWLMPPFMQKLAMITPQYWANTAAALLQKGHSLFASGIELIMLTAYLALFFILCLFALRRKKSTEAFL